MPGSGYTWSCVAEPLWRALAAADGPRLHTELVATTGAKSNSVAAALHYWCKRGLIAAIGDKPRSYIMTASPGALVTRRRQPTKRQRIWSAIRILKRFDVPTVMIAAETERGTVEAYLRMLCRAGLVERVTPGAPSRGVWASYRMASHSGPLAPSVRHERDGDVVRLILTDRNDRRRYDISTGSSSSQACVDGGVG